MPNGLLSVVSSLIFLLGLTATVDDISAQGQEPQQHELRRSTVIDLLPASSSYVSIAKQYTRVLRGVVDWSDCRISLAVEAEDDQCEEWARGSARGRREQGSLTPVRGSGRSGVLQTLGQSLRNPASRSPPPGVRENPHYP
ncbi:hypothetical protein V8E36_000544 [Tilletia maclaganii]